MLKRTMASGTCLVWLLAGMITLGVSAVEAQGQASGKPHQHATGPLPPVVVTPGGRGGGVHDFGLRNPNDLIWVEFKIKNVGSQTLYISEVKPSCKCTVPTLDSKVIEPGASITVKASIDLRGSLGNVKKPFYVHFDGYARPVECVIKGELSYPVKISPDKPSIGSLRNCIGQLTMTSIDGRPFKPLFINGKPPVVLGQNTPGEQATEWRVRYDITVKDAKDLPYMLLIETDHPQARMLDVRLRGQLISSREMDFIKQWNNIFVNRNNVNLGLILKGESAEFETSVMRPDHSSPCKISFDREGSPMESDDIAVEIVSIIPIDGRPKEEMYKLRVTNISDENKVIQRPVYFHSGENMSRLWIGGRLIPTPEDDPAFAAK